MKAYLGIKYHSDNRNKNKIDHISRIIEKYKYSVTCIARDIEEWGQKLFSPKELMEKTFEIIDSCDIVIIDLSEKGVGLGIEAGYGYSKSKPVITISENRKISTTLLGISGKSYVYSKISELEDFFKECLNTSI